MGNYLNGAGKEFCLYCEKSRTPEGHDGCIGTLEGVMNACCGHGEIKMAYIQFNHANYNKEPNKIRITGKEAIDYIEARALKPAVEKCTYQRIDTNAQCNV